MPWPLHVFQSCINVSESCSCYGAVLSLSGDAERDVAVEAVGQDECSLYSEDTVTDEDGRFRLRGLLVSIRRLRRDADLWRLRGKHRQLPFRHSSQKRLALPLNRAFKESLTDVTFLFQPGCKYLIQLRAEGNDHIERALPQHRSIEVGRSLNTAFHWLRPAESFRQQKSFHFQKNMLHSSVSALRLESAVVLNKGAPRDLSFFAFSSDPSDMR